MGRSQSAFVSEWISQGWEEVVSSGSPVLWDSVIEPVYLRKDSTYVMVDKEGHYYIWDHPGDTKKLKRLLKDRVDLNEAFELYL
jgi:hypothetical protein